MCGRYALGIRTSFVRYRMRQVGLPVDEAPDDDEVRESYNFAPGYRGLVYRADTPPSGARYWDGSDGAEREPAANDSSHDEAQGNEPPTAGDPTDVATDPATDNAISEGGDDASTPKLNQKSQDRGSARYKLQAMQWGLVPFWTKRDPGFGGMLKTINCRDDSLAAGGGMWATMKRNKRCIVVAQGFYEWLKKDGGRVKVPHFVKRPDGQLMCFAGLWDCVQYEGSDKMLWTYTIVTTDNNSQLSFLHDRMPVIFDHDSDALMKWLDPRRTEWTKELQDLLKPYSHELECYPVSQEVGKVGNNSPNFIVPVDSSENKNNIANFFGNARSKGSPTKANIKRESDVEIKSENDKKLETTEPPQVEDNTSFTSVSAGDKHGLAEAGADGQRQKQIKLEDTDIISPKKSPTKQSSVERSSVKPSSTNTQGRKTKSATSNGSAGNSKKPKPSPSDGSRKITSFFGK